MSADSIQQFIEQNLVRGRCAIDVGANQGLYTLTLLSRAERVIAFEPNPGVAQILRHTLSEYIAQKRLVVEEVALSSFQGMLTFYLDLRPGLGGAASSVNLLHGMENSTRKTSVVCTTLDFYCEANKISPDLIKIDVEGHEPAVIAGSRKIVERHRPVVIFEFWESWWTRDYRELFEYLNGLYYLWILQTGKDAYKHYSSQSEEQLSRSSATVDIGCIPRGWSLRQVVRSAARRMDKRHR